MRARWRASSAFATTRSRSTRPFDALLEALERRASRSRARNDRGEHAGAHPRHAADGAVEQDRLDRAHDRQQVRDGGRLCDALRRHGGRLRRAEGHLQDARLPAGALSQRARPRDPRADPRRGRRRRSCGRTRPTRTRCRPTTCSTAFSRRTSSRTRAPPRSLPPGFPRRTCAGSCSSSSAPSTSDASPRSGIRITPRGFGKDWRYPITSAWARDGHAATRFTEPVSAGRFV